MGEVFRPGVRITNDKSACGKFSYGNVPFRLDDRLTVNYYLENNPVGIHLVF